ncbi:acylneuraminate cytidylyltransferase family protein [Candidatus Pelagibacter ubique]|nr:acylneuraminate cytidylyltransferase family protein [Candidatus Pelagibacter ubique]
MKYIAIIPCRKNSKGIKNKNIKLFNKKPLLYWTIKVAKQTKLIEKIFVTSDSDRIISIAKKFGVNSIKRPKKLATDLSTSESAILHALKKINYNFKNIIFLQATSPLRKKDDITKAIKYFEKKKLDSLFSSCLADSIHLWKYSNNKLKHFENTQSVRKPRQLNNNKFLENGSLYIFNRQKFLKYKSRFFGKIGTYIMDKKYSYEIDTHDDFNFLEIYAKKLKNNI